MWGAYALLMVLLAVPVFSTVLPPLFDYPNHLARMHVLAEGGNEFFAVQWGPLPNLAQDIIVPPLSRLIPLEIASKLFLVMIFGLIAGGTIWLNRAVTGRWRLWPLVAFLLLYNRIFLWGFVNYLFGIGLALVGVASWLSLERKRWWVRILVSSTISLLCYVSHIAAFGCYALVILGLEAAPGIGELVARRWSILVRRIVVAVPQFVIPSVFILGYWHPAAADLFRYGDFWDKADLFFSVFDNYSYVFDIACCALFLTLIGWLASTRRLGLDRRRSTVVCLVFFVFLALPNQIEGGSGVDHRVPVALLLFLVGLSAPRFPSRRVAWAIGVGAFGILVLRLAIIETVWRHADAIYSADIIGIDALPRGAKLAVSIPPDAIQLVPVPEVHLPALAIQRRDAFVPTFFAYPGQQPVIMTPPYAALATAVPPQSFWVALVDGNVQELGRVLAVLKQYDYVAFAANQTVNVLPFACLRPFFQQPSFQLFRVLHDPDCLGQED